MTKADLITLLQTRIDLARSDVEEAVRIMLDHLSQALAQQQRIEVRGFGSFSVSTRAPRMGRNPRTGEAVAVGAKYVPQFRPGKELRARVQARQA